MSRAELLRQHPNLKTLTYNEHQLASRTIVANLSSALDIYSSYIRQVAALSHQSSFHTIQLLLPKNRVSRNWKEALRRKFPNAPTIVSADGTTVDMVINDIHVQIMNPEVSSNELDLLQAYLGYGNCGDLFAIVAKSLQFDLDKRGIRLVAKDGDVKLKDIHLTSSWHDILTLLGYNSYNFSYGMRSESNLFAYVYSGKFTDKDALLGVINAIPEAERTLLVTNFRQYIENSDRGSMNMATARSHPWVTYLHKHYNNRVDEFIRVKEEHRLKKMIAEKFNPEVMATVTGLKDKHLQKLMADYKASFKSDSDFSRFILASLPTTIAGSVQHFLPSWEEKEELARVAAKKLQRLREQQRILARNQRRQMKGPSGPRYHEQKELLHNSSQKDVDTRSRSVWDKMFKKAGVVIESEQPRRTQYQQDLDYWARTFRVNSGNTTTTTPTPFYRTFADNYFTNVGTTAFWTTNIS